jgi:hypothetical protein
MPKPVGTFEQEALCANKPGTVTWEEGHGAFLHYFVRNADSLRKMRGMPLPSEDIHHRLG